MIYSGAYLAPSLIVSMAVWHPFIAGSLAGVTVYEGWLASWAGVRSVLNGCKSKNFLVYFTGRGVAKVWKMFLSRITVPSLGSRILSGFRTASTSRTGPPLAKKFGRV